MHRISPFILLAFVCLLSFDTAFGESRVLTPRASTRPSARPTSKGGPGNSQFQSRGTTQTTQQPAQQATQQTLRAAPRTAPATGTVNSAPRTAPATGVNPAYSNTQQRPSTTVPRVGTPGQRRVIRRVASNSTTRLRTRRYIGSPDEVYRIGLIGGMATASSGYGETSTTRNAYELGKNLLFGLTADLRFMRYVGFELDGYYGLGPTQTVEYAGATEKISLTQLGGMANVKGQYPVYTGNVRWVGKLGLGFGYVGLKSKYELTSSGTTVNQNTTETFTGPYAVIGFDVEPIREVIVMVDYARSISASGKYKVDGDASAEADLEGNSFDRIRAGVLVRPIDHFLVGAQYVRRTMNSSTEVNPEDTGAVSSRETLSQFLGTLMVEF
jgi:hypothetical protein